MARMYPSQLSNEIPEPERRVYETLGHGLSDDFTLIHRINFPDPEGGRRREIDMLLVHPKLGLLAIEVQGGAVGVTSGGQWQWRGANGSIGNIENPYRRAQDDRAALSRWLRNDRATADNEMMYNRHIGFAVALPDTDATTAKLGLTASSRNMLDAADMRDPATAINRIMGHAEAAYQMSAPMIAVLTDRLTGMQRGPQGAITQQVAATGSNRAAVIAGVIATIAVIALLGWLVISLTSSKNPPPANVAVAEPTATPTTARAAIIPSATPIVRSTRPTATPITLVAQFSPTPTPPKLAIGVDATVNVEDGLYVRKEPSKDGEPIVKLAQGVKVHIIGGPQGEGDNQWWQVVGWPDSSNGETGWCAGLYLKPVK